MQICHVHSFQHTLPYEWLSVLLCHEEYSVFLKVNGAIAGHHLAIILQSSDLDLRVFGWNQILQAQYCRYLLRCTMCRLNLHKRHPYQCQVLSNTLSMSHVPTQQSVIALEKLQYEHGCLKLVSCESVLDVIMYHNLAGSCRCIADPMNTKTYLILPVKEKWAVLFLL